METNYAGSQVQTGQRYSGCKPSACRQPDRELQSKSQRLSRPRGEAERTYGGERRRVVHPQVGAVPMDDSGSTGGGGRGGGSGHRLRAGSAEGTADQAAGDNNAGILQGMRLGDLEVGEDQRKEEGSSIGWRWWSKLSRSMVALARSRLDPPQTHLAHS